MSRQWDGTKAALVAAGQWSDATFKRGDKDIRVWRLLNTERKLYIVHNDIPHCIFHAHKVSKDRTEVGYNAATAKWFKIEAFAAAAASPL